MKFFSAVILIFAIGQLNAQNSVSPGAIRLDATFESISVLWDIEGDANLTSTLSIEFRETGGVDYQEGAHTMRANPNSVIDGASASYNYHGGSIWWLIPDTEYEVRLSLVDPDGGSATEVRSVRTKKELPAQISGNLRYVVPGSGGGSGSIGDPFLGLQSAADQAQPGDIFEIAEGEYDAFSIDVSGTPDQPIVFRGSTQGDSVLIDGDNTARGVVTLGESLPEIKHIVLEYLTIENGSWGIDAIHASHITVRHCAIRNVNSGYVNRRDAGLDSDQTLSDNVFIGRTSWPGSGIPSDRAIDLRGNNNVVRYNRIRNFGDGISTDGPPYQRNFSVDIHNNDIAYIVDDAIEVDGAVANSRIWSNRCVNARAGISLAPIYGGPAYVVRNFLFNFENSALKMNRGPAGLLISHNTIGSSNRGTTSPSGFQNTRLLNNLIFAGEYVFEEYDLAPTAMFNDWDGNGYSSERAGDASAPWFKWDNVRYAQIVDLQAAGLQPNSMAFDHVTDLQGAPLPSDYEAASNPETLSFQLDSDATVIDNGLALAHLNLPFVEDGLPDLGALEHGQEMVHLGPRSQDLSTAVDLRVDPQCIEIFPNPTSGEFQIAGMLGAYTINVQDENGQLIRTITGADYASIDLTTLPAGTYFLLVEQRASPFLCTQLIIKQ
ncbi:MAG: right-handed parallel beta-helix repeat-containing protein [Saprospiraceae bacterium]|nr:right-handed parallel beta-helix repeat-containing protein [Saprospiraceae bacterium]